MPRSNASPPPAEASQPDPDAPTGLPEESVEGAADGGLERLDDSAELAAPPASGGALQLDPELLAELPAFEQFFKTFGFKRMHGRVWGLLVLSEAPLSSKEICEQLEISQGAASTTLSELLEWGAITRNFDSSRRCHVHGPVGNALSIAATILHRREQVAFQQFRLTAERSRNFIAKRYGERDPRVLTLRSIIAACEIADALMKLLVGTVANALGDSQSLLSRAIHAALRVGLPAPADSPAGIFAQAIERSHQAGVEQTLDIQDDLPPRGDLPPTGSADDSAARPAAS
ncbi:MAG: GbsR/MarR family transcriptional regulator [Planctomycetota bacterium]